MLNIVQALRHLAEAVVKLTVSVGRLSVPSESHGRPVTTKDLQEMEKRIMSAISEYLARLKTYKDELATQVGEVAGDVDDLIELVKQIQTSPGEFSPEDQATADNLESGLKAVSDAIKAINALTPPKPPVG